MEENNAYDVTVEESSDRGICARALYDYQAGKSFKLSLCWNSFKLIDDQANVIIGIKGQLISTQF